MRAAPAAVAPARLPACPSCTGDLDASLCQVCVDELYGDPAPEWDWPDGYSRADLLFGGNW